MLQRVLLEPLPVLWSNFLWLIVRRGFGGRPESLVLPPHELKRSNYILFGGRFASLIDRNTTVPVRRSHVFTTTRDNQKDVKVRVLQGESDVAAENDLLGEFVLSGIKPAPKGEPEIEVAFDIDANGIVNVSARDNSTGLEQSITVNATSTLSDEELDRIIEENPPDAIALKV